MRYTKGNEREYYIRKVAEVFDRFEIDETYTDEGIAANVDGWLSAKAPLFALLRTHPNWNEEAKAIVFTTDEYRPLDGYIYVGVLNKLMSHLRYSIPDANIGAIRALRDIPLSQYVTKEMVAFLNNRGVTGVKVGMRLSRLVNKAVKDAVACTGMTPEELIPGYNALFAKLADAINPLNLKRFTVLSVSIVDYLTMSNGDGWSSCHYINSNGLYHRGETTYGGGYKAGCLSYALDNCSMVLYTLSSDSDISGGYHMVPKLTRQMFAYSDGALLQQRLYPRDNSGEEKNTWVKETSKTYRNGVQSIIARGENLPNLWQEKTSDTRSYVRSGGGFNYPDWQYDNFFKSLTLLNEKPINDQLIIGARPYCIDCGEPHYGEAESLVCESCGDEGVVCYNCGSIIYNSDPCHDFDGEVYCEDCVSYCEYHGIYEPRDMFHIEGYGDVCSDGIDDADDIVYCQYHERFEYHSDFDDITDVEYYGTVCVDALEEDSDFFYCKEHDRWEYECYRNPCSPDSNGEQEEEVSNERPAV